MGTYAGYLNAQRAAQRYQQAAAQRAQDALRQIRRQGRQDEPIELVECADGVYRVRPASFLKIAET